MASDRQEEEQRAPAASPRSAIRIFRLLEALSRQGEGSSLAQLSSELASPKSSLLMLLRPIVAEGYLARTNGRYMLGPRMHKLAAEILHAIEAGVFVPNTGWQCRDCQFRSRCWAWPEVEL